MPGELASCRTGPDSSVPFGAFRASSAYDPLLILSQIATLFSFFHFVLFVGESLVARWQGNQFALWNVWMLKGVLNLGTRTGKLNFLVYLFDSIVMYESPFNA